MSKSFSTFIIAGFLMLIVGGAGCGAADSDMPSNRTDLNNSAGMNSGIGGFDNASGGVVPDAENTADGYKFYISTDKGICSSQGAQDTCKAAGAEFFQDNKGCGCLSRVTN